MENKDTKKEEEKKEEKKEEVETKVANVENKRTIDDVINEQDADAYVLHEIKMKGNSFKSGAKMSTSYKPMTPIYKTGVTSMLKARQSRDQQRVIYYYEPPEGLTIGEFHDDDSFTVAKMTHIVKLINYYRGMRYDFQYGKHLSTHYSNTLINVPSTSAIGIDVINIFNELYINKERISASNIIKDDYIKLMVKTDDESITKTFPNILVTQERDLYEHFHNKEKGYLIDWRVMYKLWRGFFSTTYSTFEEPDEKMKFMKAKFFMKPIKKDYLRPLLESNSYVRSKYLESMSGLLSGFIQFNKINTSESVQLMIKEMNVSFNSLVSNINLPIQVTKMDVISILEGWLNTMALGEYRRITFDISYEQFDSFDPLLVMGIMLVRVLFPHWMISKTSKNLMDNYIVIQLYKNKMSKACFANDIQIDDYSGAKAGRFNLMDVITIVPKSVNKSDLPIKLHSFFAGGDASYADNGKIHRMAIDEKIADLVPGRSTGYIDTFRDSEDNEILFESTTDGVTKFLDLCVSFGNSGNQFWARPPTRDNDYNAMAGVLNAIYVKQSNLKTLIAKMKLLSRVACTPPIFTPMSDSGEKYDKRTDNVDDLQLSLAAVVAVPLMVDGDKIRVVGVDSIVNLFMWSFEQFTAVHEMFEYWVKACEVIGSIEQYGISDRISWLKSQTFRHKFFLFEDVVESWTIKKESAKIFTKDMVVEKDWLEDYEKVRLFVEEFNPSVWGYTKEFVWTPYNGNSFEDEIYDMSFYSNNIEIAHTFNKPSDLMDLKKNSNLLRKTMLKASSENYIRGILFKFPIRISFKKFDFVSDLPSSYSSPANIATEDNKTYVKYSSLVVYQRESHRDRENIDLSDENVFVKYPEYLVGKENMIEAEGADAEDIWSYLGKWEVFTKKLTIIHDFPVRILKNYDIFYIQ